MNPAVATTLITVELLVAAAATQTVVALTPAALALAGVTLPAWAHALICGFLAASTVPFAWFWRHRTVAGLGNSGKHQ